MRRPLSLSFHFATHITLFFLQSQYLDELLFLLLASPFLLSVVLSLSSQYLKLRLLQSCIFYRLSLHLIIVALHGLLDHLRCSCQVRSDSTVNKVCKRDKQKERRGESTYLDEKEEWSPALLVDGILLSANYLSP